MDHREQFWRWLVFGFRRLVTMTEEHAREVSPTREQAEFLREHARRLLAVADRGES